MKLKLFLLTAILSLLSLHIFAAPGALDPTFGGGYFATGTVQSTSSSPFTQMVIQPNGKIVVGANTGSPSAPQVTLYRYNATGTLDTSFGVGGVFTIPAVGGGSNWSGTNHMLLQPDGKFLVLNGNSSGATIFRIDPNGGMDTSFAGTGQVTIAGLLFPEALRVLSDGKIMIAGYQGQPIPSMSGTWFAARYNSDGSPDSGFGSGGFTNMGSFDVLKYGSVANLFIQPDGKILVCASYGVTKHFSAARFSASGALDFSFGTGGIALMPGTSFSDTAVDVKMQADGKIVFVGTRSAGLGFRMARMNVDGTPDAAFGTGGTVALTGPVISTFIAAAMAIQQDGKIVAGGYVNTAPDSIDFAVVRFNADGSVDSAKLLPKSKTRDLSLVKGESVLDDMWGNGGLATAGNPGGNENITSIGVDSVGRIVAAGLEQIHFPGNIMTSELAMARFLSDAAPLANIYGTVRTADGIPIKNVSVVLSEGPLSQPRYALTNQFGLYFFSDLPVTENYSVSISSKRFSFTADQQHVMLLHDEQAIDFTAQP